MAKDGAKKKRTTGKAKNQKAARPKGGKGDGDKKLPDLGPGK